MSVIPKTEGASTDAPEGSAPKFTNLIDLGDRFLYKVYVSGVQLRTLVGRRIVGIAPHPDGGGRSVPVYDTDTHGWLGKWFAFEVPKAEGIYDLSARAHDEDAATHIESTQVRVSKNDQGVWTITKMGYGDMIEAFGGQRLKKGNDGTLTMVSATAESAS